MGGDETPEPAPAGGGGGLSAQLGEAMQQLQKTELLLRNLAQQFPATAPSLREAQEALPKVIGPIRAALRSLITSPGQAEPPAPAIGG